jgi:hypothetical protein
MGKISPALVVIVVLVLVAVALGIHLYGGALMKSLAVLHGRH